MLLRWLALLAVLTGCLHPSSATCDNGGVCPPGLFCIDTNHTTSSGQICTAGTCGNGRHDPGEACDDGNNRSGDGCPADCSPPCGDGVHDPGEICDDGNTIDGDGCASDCLSRDGVFLISPTVVAFSLDEGAPAPADRTVTIRLGHRGDVLQVAHTELPSWLSVTERSVAANTVELALHVTDASAIGLRSTIVRLTIARDDGRASFELPVSCLIRPSDLAVQAAPLSLRFAATVGDLAVPSQPVALAFNGDEVMVDSAPAWITVAPTSATTSPATFDVSVNTTDVAAGSFLSGDIAFTAKRGGIRRTAHVHVDGTIDAPPALAIAAASDVLSFAAYAGGGTPAAQRLDVTFTGPEVSLLSAPSWLIVTSPAGPTASPAPFTIAAATTAFAPNTTQSGDLVFRVTRNLEHLDAIVHVDYRVLAAPALKFVSPYVGFTDQPGALLVTAPGLQAGIPVVIGIGDVQISATPTVNGELAISYPALAGGRYPVTLIDPPVLAALPELVIVAPAQLTYQAFDLPSLPSRLVYDAERRALYVAEPRDQQLLHFVHANGGWSSQPPHLVTKLTDIVMAPDGRSLLVLDTSALSAMSLTDGAFSMTPLMQRPSWSCDLLVQLHVAGNGKVFLMLADSRGPYGCLDLSYDLRTRSTDTTIAFFDAPTGATSGDGDRVYLRDSTFDDYFLIYDATADRTERTQLGEQYLLSLSISDNASRLIVNDADVYDRSLRRLGRFPSRDVTSSAVSRDASRAFVYAQDPPGPRLEVYDLNGELQPQGIYPLIATYTLPDPHAANRHELTMTVAPDGATVFIAGTRKLIVVPVQ